MYWFHQTRCHVWWTKVRLCNNTSPWLLPHDCALFCNFRLTALHSGCAQQRISCIGYLSPATTQLCARGSTMCDLPLCPPICTDTEVWNAGGMHASDWWCVTWRRPSTATYQGAHLATSMHCPYPFWLPAQHCTPTMVVGVLQAKLGRNAPATHACCHLLVNVARCMCVVLPQQILAAFRQSKGSSYAFIGVHPSCHCMHILLPWLSPHAVV